ncbi:MAG: hypothetical protein R3B72_52055 [Polyangiaceae bacterium]
MWDWVRSVLGEASKTEIALAGVFVLCVTGFNWAPRIGEAIGGMFEPPPDDES